MATINFYLKSPNKESNCLILFAYQDRGNKFRYSTGIQVQKSNWNGSRLKGKSLDVIKDNIKLDRLEGIIRNIEKRAAELNVQYSFEMIEYEFRLDASQAEPEIVKPGQWIKPDAKGREKDFFDLYESFVDGNRHKRARQTIQGYITTKRCLGEFGKVKKIEVSFQNINQRFYEQFMNYLIVDRGMLNNTIGKHVKTLKVFINYIKNNEIIDCKINLNGFKVLKEDIDIVALKESELMKIFNLQDLPPTLDIVKDQFCFECFTGIRFSDVGKIQNENVKEDFLEFRTQKTKDALLVPLNVFAKEIIEKYKGRYTDRPLPPTFSNGQTNYFIKDIAEIAGLNEVIIIEKFSGANRLIIKKPKCDLISTHTGRRTFITVSYEKGMQPEMIMKITGLKSWNTLKKYMRVSEQMKLIKMNEFWTR